MMPKRRPLVSTLTAVADVTLAYKKQLAADTQRSSVKAKAYPSQFETPQHAMRQAPSEGAARGASVRGAPTRSVRGRERKREGGQEWPGVRVEVGVVVWLEEGVEVIVWLGDGVSLGVGKMSAAGRHGRATPKRAEAGTVVWP